MFWRSPPFGFPPPTSSAAIERLFARHRIAYASPSPPPPDPQADGAGTASADPAREARLPETEDRRRLALLDALLDSEQADILNECKVRSGLRAGRATRQRD